MSARRSRLWLLGALVLALAFPASAGAVTILLGPPDLSAADPFASCDALAPELCTAKTFVPTSLPEPGAMLVTPADGTIVSWRVRGAPPGKLRLRILRAAGGGQFTGVDTSGVAKVSDGVVDNPAAIGVLAESQVGINVENVPLNVAPTTLLGNANAPGATWSTYASGLGDDSTAAPTSTGSGAEPLFNATVVLQKPLVFNLTSTQGPESGGDVVVVNGFHLAVATSVTFGDVPAQILVAGNNQLTVVAPPHAPGAVNVAVNTAGGSNDDSSATSRYTYTALPLPAPDTTAPKLSGFLISPRSFKARNGARISFRSSEDAFVKFSVLRKSPSNHGPYKALPGSFDTKAAAGPNKLHFAARLKGRKLQPGRYRLVALAGDAVGNKSKALRRSFKVLP